MENYDYTYYGNRKTLYNTYNNYNRPIKSTVFRGYYINPVNRIISQKGGNIMVNAAMVQDYAETIYRVNSDRIDNLEKKVNKINSIAPTTYYNFNGSNNNITINNYGKN